MVFRTESSLMRHPTPHPTRWTPLVGATRVSQHPKVAQRSTIANSPDPGPGISLLREEPMDAARNVGRVHPASVESGQWGLRKPLAGRLPVR